MIRVPYGLYLRLHWFCCSFSPKLCKLIKKCNLCFRQRLSQLQLMALILVYVRKTNYFEKSKTILHLKWVSLKNELLILCSARTYCCWYDSTGLFTNQIEEALLSFFPSSVHILTNNYTSQKNFMERGLMIKLTHCIYSKVWWFWLFGQN